MMHETTDKIIILTAPSGAGKTSITKHLLKAFPERLAFSISAATRPSRSNEKNGHDYYFISTDEFNEKIQLDEFVEWEMVYEGKYYGTLKSELQRIWKQNKIPLLDVDVKGAIHVKEQFPDNCLSFFIEPPSVDELKRRLSKRGMDSEEMIAARTNKAGYELSFKQHFNHILVNHDLDQVCKEAERIVAAFVRKK